MGDVSLSDSRSWARSSRNCPRLLRRPGARARVCLGGRSTRRVSVILRFCPQTYRKNVQQMIQGLVRKLATLSQYEEVLAKISSTSTDRLTVLKTKPQSIQRDIITVCSDPYTLAQQLTHIELVRSLSPFAVATHTLSAVTSRETVLV